MNIRYRGKSKETNNWYLAEILYNPTKEFDKILRFHYLMNYKLYENHFVDIPCERFIVIVDDKDDYESVKKLYMAYKYFDYKKYCKELGINKYIEDFENGDIDYKELYKECKHNVDMYIILICKTCYCESEIKEIIEHHFGIKAYRNAIKEFCKLIIGE